MIQMPLILFPMKRCDQMFSKKSGTLHMRLLMKTSLKDRVNYPQSMFLKHLECAEVQKLLSVGCLYSCAFGRRFAHCQTMPLSYSLFLRAVFDSMRTMFPLVASFAVLFPRSVMIKTSLWSMLCALSATVYTTLMIVTKHFTEEKLQRHALSSSFYITGNISVELPVGSHFWKRFHWNLVKQNFTAVIVSLKIKSKVLSTKAWFCFKMWIMEKDMMIAWQQVSYKMTFHHVFIYLDLVCILYPVCSLQSAFCTRSTVCSLRFVLTESFFQEQWVQRLIFLALIPPLQEATMSTNNKHKRF